MRQPVNSDMIQINGGRPSGMTEETQVEPKTKTSFWQGAFGDQYIDRNDRSAEETDAFFLRALGVSRTELFQKTIAVAKPASVMEIGCNVGQNFPLLHAISKGLHLTGVEINFNAARSARSDHANADIVQASAFHLPFTDSCTDLAFTAGVLIHMHPDDLPMAVDEIWRISRKHILGLEYYSERLEHVSYRGHDGLLWKQDFARVFRERFGNLRTVYSDVYEYAEEVFGRKGLYYQVYLLEKT